MGLVSVGWISSAVHGIVIFSVLPFAQSRDLGGRWFEHLAVVVKSVPPEGGGQGGEGRLHLHLRHGGGAGEVQGRDWGIAALQCRHHCLLLGDLRPQSFQLRQILLL